MEAAVKMVWVQGMDWREEYAVSRSDCARAAAGLVAGGLAPPIVQPVFVKLPEETPMSPTTTEPPVQVTFVPPRTENCDAAPSDTWAHAGETPASSAAIPSVHVDTNFMIGLAEISDLFKY